MHRKGSLKYRQYRILHTVTQFYFPSGRKQKAYFLSLPNYCPTSVARPLSVLKVAPQPWASNGSSGPNRHSARWSPGNKNTSDVNYLLDFGSAHRTSYLPCSRTRLVDRMLSSDLSIDQCVIGFADFLCEVRRIFLFDICWQQCRLGIRRKTKRWIC